MPIRHYLVINYIIFPFTLPINVNFLFQKSLASSLVIRFLEIHWTNNVFLTAIFIVLACFLRCLQIRPCIIRIICDNTCILIGFNYASVLEYIQIQHMLEWTYILLCIYGSVLRWVAFPAVISLIDYTVGS